MVDEVDGVIDGHTQHHRDQRGGHHVQRDAGPAHVTAHEDSGHQVRDESDQAHADALEGDHQDDGDDEYGDQEGLHLAADQVLHHGRVLRDVAHGCHIDTGEHRLRLLGDVVQFTFHLARVEVGNLHHQAQALVIVVHPVFRLGTTGVFVENQHLGHFLLGVGDAEISLVSAVERLVQVLEDVQDGVGALGERIGADEAFQLFQFLQVFGLLGLVLVLEFHHQVIGIQRAEFAPAHGQDVLHIRDLDAHRALDVKGRFDLPQADEQGRTHDDKGDDNGLGVLECKVVKPLHSPAQARAALAVDTRLRLLVLTEGKKDGRHQQGGEQDEEDGQGTHQTHAFHRADRDDHERHQGNHGGQATEDHGPADFADRLDDGLLPLAVKTDLMVEIREDVDVIRDGHGKGQNDRNHQDGAVDIHL